MKATATFAVALALAGCAQTAVAPVERAPPTSAEPEREVDLEPLLARRRQLALRAEAAGDLRAALQQWQILALIAPDDRAIRDARDAAQAALARAVADGYRAATAALRKGDTEAGVQGLLRVLALQPEHTEAARQLRALEQQRSAKLQAERAARLKPEFIALMNRAARAQRKPPPDAGNGYDLEQSLELLRTGNVDTALVELRRIVDAAPANKALRGRIAGEVHGRAARAEAAGERELALRLYEQAIALRGEAPAAWRAQVSALKKALAAEAYEKGLRAYKSDVALAIKYWEISLRHEPNAALELRLQEARRMQHKLQQIEKERARGQ
jgi:tetratricopeptide (TPR) repeat protein